MPRIKVNISVKYQFLAVYIVDDVKSNRETFFIFDYIGFVRYPDTIQSNVIESEIILQLAIEAGLRLQKHSNLFQMRKFNDGCPTVAIACSVLHVFCG